MKACLKRDNHTGWKDANGAKDFPVSKKSRTRIYEKRKLMKSYLLVGVRNSSARNLTWFSFPCRHSRAEIQLFFSVRILVKNDATIGLRVICSFKINHVTTFSARAQNGQLASEEDCGQAYRSNETEWKATMQENGFISSATFRLFYCRVKSWVLLY